MSDLERLHRLSGEMPAKPTPEHLREIIATVYSADYVPVSKNQLYTKLTGNGNRYAIETAFTFLEIKGFIRVEDGRAGRVYPTI